MFKMIANGIEVQMFVGICDFEYKEKQKLKVTPSLVEIANLALFLIETKSITNQNIVIDGGQNLISNQDIIFQ